MYALPLLLFSIVINFGGTFLTLDRTRVFPRNESKEYSYSYTSDENEVTYTGKKKRGSNGRGVGRWAGWSYRLDGGVGGLLAGYVLGCMSPKSHPFRWNTLAYSYPSTRSYVPRIVYSEHWIVFSVVSSDLLGRLDIRGHPFYALRWKVEAGSAIMHRYHFRVLYFASISVISERLTDLDI